MATPAKIPIEEWPEDELRWQFGVMERSWRGACARRLDDDVEFWIGRGVDVAIELDRRNTQRLRETARNLKAAAERLREAEAEVQWLEDLLRYRVVEPWGAYTPRRNTRGLEIAARLERVAELVLA